MKIKHIETLAVSLPMVKPLKMAFEEVKSAENVLVRLETDGGVIGWGGAATAPTMTGETVQSMTAAIRYLAPKLEGMPLDDIAAIMARAGNYLYGNQSAKSVIEMALHDALGRAAGKPVHDLLGTKRREPHTDTVHGRHRQGHRRRRRGGAAHAGGRPRRVQDQGRCRRSARGRRAHAQDLRGARRQRRASSSAPTRTRATRPNRRSPTCRRSRTPASPSSSSRSPGTTSKAWRGSRRRAA